MRKNKISVKSLGDAIRNGDLREGNEELLLELLQSMGEEDAHIAAQPIKDGWTALHFAACYGTEAMVAHLTTILGDEAARVAALTTKDGWTPLHSAARHGTEAMVAHLTTILGDEAARVAALPLDSGWTPLHLAARYGNEAMVAHLTTILGEKAARVAALPNKNGWTPLDIAARYSNEAMVAHLMSILGDEAARVAALSDKDGWTPLHIAARYGNEAMVAHLTTILGDEAARVAALPLDDGWTALHQAARYGTEAMVAHLTTILGEKAARVAALPNNHGWTPLHLAARYGNEAMVAGLTSIPGDEAARVAALPLDNGWTPLHLAASHGNLGIVKYLISQYGLDPDQTTKKGTSTIDLAKKSGNQACITFLSNPEACQQVLAIYLHRRLINDELAFIDRVFMDKVTSAKIALTERMKAFPDDSIKLIKPLHDSIIKGCSNWECLYDLLVVLADVNIEQATQALEDCNTEIVKRYDRQILRNSHRRQENLSALEAFTQKLKSHPGRDVYYSHSYDCATHSLKGHYFRHYETLLEKAKSNDALALEELKTLAIKRPDAAAFLGAFYQHKAEALFERLTNEYDLIGAKRRKVNALFSQAQVCYQQAIKQGSGVAHYRMGLLLESDQGGAQDKQAAIYHFYQAAIRNHTASKTHLKTYSHQTEDQALAALANLYESFGLELTGDPEYFYGNYYLSSAYDTDNKALYENIKDMLIDEHFALSIRLPLAQLVACKMQDASYLDKLLDQLILHADNPERQAEHLRLSMKFLTAKTLCQYALDQFDDTALPYPLRVKLMGIAKEKATQTQYANEEFNEKYQLIESDVLKLMASSNILPPKPSAPPLESTILGVPRDQVENDNNAPILQPNIPTFGARLDAIHYNEDDLPEEFFCELTSLLMDTPVITPSGHTISLEAYSEIKARAGKDPWDNTKRISGEPTKVLYLLNKIDKFVRTQEKEAAEREESVKANESLASDTPNPTESETVLSDNSAATLFADLEAQPAIYVDALLDSMPDAPTHEVVSEASDNESAKKPQKLLG